MLRMLYDYVGIKFRSGMDMPRIRKYQLRKARKMVRYAVRKSPFFRRYYGGYI